MDQEGTCGGGRGVEPHAGSHFSCTRLWRVAVTPATDTTREERDRGGAATEAMTNVYTHTHTHSGSQAAVAARGEVERPGGREDGKEGGMGLFG